MKPRPFVAYTFTLFVGIAIGIIGTIFLVHFKAYANVPAHVAQGHSILKRITAYQDKNGKLPDQQWFDSLGEMTKTSEDYQWIYHNPPIILSKNRSLVMTTATNYDSRYLGGFLDGTVIFTDLKTTKESEQDAPSNGG